jgi:hypothetical protein
MARDNSPQIRQLKRAELKTKRAPFDRILIVTEGSKTEPLYFQEIKAHLRLPNTNISVLPSKFGTDPLSVVKYAQELFEHGDQYKNIAPRSFEKVFAVFDRDDHTTYINALNKAKTLDGKLKNDEKKYISFQAIPSIPCFEIWLLLHFEDVNTPLHRTEVFSRLKRHLPKYEKNSANIFEATRKNLQDAMQRAKILSDQHNEYEELYPFSAIADLVLLLYDLQK